MKTVFAMILSLSTLLSSLSGGFSSSAEAPEAPASAPGFLDETEYVHYDPEDFYAETDRLRTLADKGDEAGINALYDELYQEFLYIDSLSVLAMLRSDQNIYDEYWSREYNYMNLLWSEAEDALFSACGYVLQSDCAASFTEHVGQDTADVFLSHAPLTEEELDSKDREMDLIDRYRALYDTIDDISCEYGGETWTLNMFYGDAGDALYETDYSAYRAVYSAIQKALNDTFAPIYIELVDIWRAEAERAGYDTYSEYAYDYLYGRCYTPEDAQLLCDAVKPIAREYYADLYYSDMSYSADEAAPVFTGEELLDLLGEYLPRVDESLLEPWAELAGRCLYDIAPSAPGRYDGAYTTTMLYFRSPFLFASLEGTCEDLITATHEFGHFADFWFNPQTNLFTQTDDLDLSEIHSNALQALFTAFYGEIYDEGADTAEFINLAFLLENIIDGCVYDEFQRRVLDSGEPLTPESLNAIHTQVCAEYGLYDDQDWDSTWVYISHNFEQPLYYISYAASALAALQIWDMAQTDFAAAAEVYRNVLGYGAHSEDYFTVLESCGLRLFREEGAAEEICRPVLDRLAVLDAAYYG